MKLLHPTAQLLIETVTNLLDSKAADEITSDEVLALSGISRGSLYHHFEDFDDLVDSALVKRFGRYIAETTAGFAALNLAVRSGKDLQAGLHKMTRWAHVPERAQYRFERIRVFARASEKPRLRQKLAAEQDALTTAQAEQISKWQAKGFVTTAYDARTIAVAIQAIVLGRVVDEIGNVHMDSADWLKLMDQLTDLFIIV